MAVDYPGPTEPGSGAEALLRVVASASLDGYHVSAPVYSSCRPVKPIPTKFADFEKGQLSAELKAKRGKVLTAAHPPLALQRPLRAARVKPAPRRTGRRENKLGVTREMVINARPKWQAGKALNGLARSPHAPDTALKRCPILNGTAIRLGAPAYAALCFASTNHYIGA